MQDDNAELRDFLKRKIEQVRRENNHGDPFGQVFTEGQFSGLREVALYLGMRVETDSEFRRGR